MKTEKVIVGVVKFLEDRIAERKDNGLDVELLEETQKSYGKMLNEKRR